MIENNPSNVSSAFEMLLEEVEAEIDFVNGVGARGFEGRDYEKAREALERTGLLTAFRDKVAALRKEWESLAAVAEREEDEETPQSTRTSGACGRVCVPRNRSTTFRFSERWHRWVDAEGSDVLDRVGTLMKPILRDVDFDPLASEPSNPRWRNAAQWARNSMVQEELLRGSSPRGIWEISDKGRAFLEGRK